MGYIRITADIRDGVIANALKQRFAADRLVIQEQEELVARLTRERDAAGYEAAFTAKDRERLSAAPGGWFPKSNSVKVAVEDTNEVLEIKFAEAQRVPYEFYESRHGSTHIASIIKPDHPYMVARAAVKSAKEDLGNLKSTMHEAEQALRARVRAVVESVTSVARLVEVWPEASELLPEVYAGPKATLPATLISDLNAELGLQPAREG